MPKRLRTMDLAVPSLEAMNGSEDEFIDRWRQLHYVAQAVVEAGKSWGEVRDDDSHSAMVVDDKRIVHDWFVSETAVPGISAKLEITRGQVMVEGADGASTWLRTEDKTIEELTRDVRRYLTLLAGEPKQASKPAPDLPDHPLGDGAMVNFEQHLMGDVGGLYTMTSELLTRFVAAVSELADNGLHELTPRLWPHHFDLASLLVCERDADGAMTRTVGVGVTPPDDVEGSGYWYVSPWSKAAVGTAFAFPELPVGRWVERGDLAMAVLPVSEVMALVVPSDEALLSGSRLRPPLGCVVAEFIATAFNACMDHFEKN